jgi:ankyrin repeat protein
MFSNKGRRVIILEQLLSYGANLNIQNSDGQTPLHIAAMTGYFPYFKRAKSEALELFFLT